MFRPVFRGDRVHRVAVVRSRGMRALVNRGRCRQCGDWLALFKGRNTVPPCARQPVVSCHKATKA